MIKTTITNKSIAIFLLSLLFLFFILTSSDEKHYNRYPNMKYDKGAEFIKKIDIYVYFLKKQLDGQFGLMILSQLYPFPFFLISSSESAGLRSMFDKPISLDELENIYIKYKIQNFYYIKFISLYSSQLSILLFAVISCLSSLLAHLFTQSHSMNPIKIISLGLFNFLTILGVIFAYSSLYPPPENTVNKKIKLLYYIIFIILLALALMIVLSGAHLSNFICVLIYCIMVTLPLYLLYNHNNYFASFLISFTLFFIFLTFSAYGLFLNLFSSKIFLSFF